MGKQEAHESKEDNGAEVQGAEMLREKTRKGNHLGSQFSSTSPVFWTACQDPCPKASVRFPAEYPP